MVFFHLCHFYVYLCLVTHKDSFLQADLETRNPEEAAKLASETEQEASVASPLREPEPVTQVNESSLRLVSDM